MVKRVALLVLGTLVVMLVLTTVAVAWTPQEIYDDFAQNGKLTREYTDTELRAYLNDATLVQYPEQVVKTLLDSAVAEQLDRDTFPFTGFQLIIAGVVVVALVGGGVALRLFSRPRKPSQGS
ncbi:MAG: hypothetical protein JXA57_12260 [Armatimonadetes bacterium]|nr:hypothetical protein [Armatimonadota bacterium]